jgi:ABC-type lipoprotein release transport system permease subunit
VPVGGTLLGAVLAVSVAVTALTFSASLDHLFSTPRLYGVNWDYRSELGAGYQGLTTKVIAALAAVKANPAIADVAYGIDPSAGQATARVNGLSVSIRGMDDLKGRLPPVVTKGRAPLRIDEILLGTKTLAALGVSVGDFVTVQGSRTVRMRVVGQGVLPQGLRNGLGSGAAMTFRAYARDILVGQTPYVLQARVARGADRQKTLQWLEQRFFDPAPGPPRAIADFGGVQAMPFVLSALFAAMAAGALAHALATTVRSRRRDLAILKTLGFDRRQMLSAVRWQATTYAAIGLLVGVPIGFVAGRWAWNMFADEIGVVPESVTPVGLILLVVPVVIVLANLVAVVPAWVAARVRPALVLRAE